MTSRRAKACLWVTLLGTVSAQPQVRTTQPPRGKPARPGPAYFKNLKFFEESAAATKAVLRNGLTVLIHENRAHPVVTASIIIPTGYGSSAGATGIADVVAQMHFRGTRNRTPSIFARDLGTIGGRVESRVEFDHTAHDMVAPSAQWKKVLELEADALLNPLAHDGEFERAVRDFRAAGSVQGRDPDVRAREALFSLSFDGRGPGRMPRRRAAEAEKLQAAQVAGFVEAEYVPSRVLLLVTGDVTSTEILSEAVRLFARPAKAADKQPVPGIQDHAPGPRFAQERGIFPRPQALFGFMAPGLNAPEAAAVDVLCSLLGNGQGSRIGRRIRGQKGAALRGFSGWTAHAGQGLLWMQLEVEPDGLDRAEIALVTELELLRSEPPTDEEIERAISQLEREFWSSLQTTQGRARQLARFELAGNWKRTFQYVAALRKVSPSDVHRAAREYLRMDRIQLLEALPTGGEPRNLAADTVFRTLNELLPASTRQEAVERERETVPAVAMPAATDPFKASEVRYGYRLASVLRGPEIYVKEDHNLPLIQLGWYFPCGAWAEAKDNSGISALTLRSMLRGSRSLDAAQFHRRLELLGATIRPVVREDHFGFEVETLSRNIDQCLTVVAEIFRNPALEEKEILRERKGLIAEIDRRRSGAGTLGRLLAAAELFRNHPYERDALGDKGVVTGLDPEAVRAWYAKNMSRRRPLVIIHGDTQGTSLAGFFVKNFSGARFEEVRLQDAFPAAMEAEARLEAASPDGEDHVMVWFQAPPVADVDASVARVLRSYMADGAGALSEILQRNRGFARELEVRYESMPRGGAFLLGFAGSSLEEEMVLKTLREELAKVQEGPILYRDFRAAVQAAAADWDIEQQDRFRQMLELARSFFAGKGLQGFEEVRALVQEVQQEDLSALAQRTFRLDKSVVVRLKPGK